MNLDSALKNRDKDPKTIVTPLAFNIAPSVLYTPLASPLKRGLAMIIDGLLISVLAEQAGAVFILLVGLTLLIERKSHQLGRALKWLLYAAMLLMTIWVTSDNLIEFKQGSNSDTQQSDSKDLNTDKLALASLKLLPDTLSLTLCESRLCADKQLTLLASKLANVSLSEADKQQMLLDIVSELELPPADKADLSHTVSEMFASNIEITSDSAEARVATAAGDEITAKAPLSISEASTISESSLTQTDGTTNEAIIEETRSIPLPNSDSTDTNRRQSDNSDHAPYSLLAWAKGLLNDLGLGFGWAAFYFTVFTAWFDGQTLGKKLLNIRVIQLDGTVISLWDAFGRYGGYGAGFATGLLGFLQIFWDANRQAIQDKISATVVIDLSKKRLNPTEPTRGTAAVTST